MELERICQEKWDKPPESRCAKLIERESEYFLKSLHVDP